MLFDLSVWNDFKATPKGKNLIEYFSNYTKTTKTKSDLDAHKHIMECISFEKIEQNISEKKLCKTFKDLSFSSNKLLQSLINKGVYVDVSSFEEFDELYERIMRWTDPDDRINPPLILNPEQIPYESKRLYFLYPEYCFPYLFGSQYYQLEGIFKEFGLFAPSIPLKNDKYGRVRHYLELCKSAYDFRIRYGMDKYEFPAFLYGLALEIVQKYKATDVLPEPKKAYFADGSKYLGISGDFTYLDNADDSSVSIWFGNPETQLGDILVMYCAKPRKYIHSIWRAVSPGFRNPFYHVYKAVFAGRPIVVKPLTLYEMKSDDDVLANMPAIKSSLRVVDGKVIDKRYYERIIDLLDEKGFAIENLPQLDSNYVPNKILMTDKDIERHLLRPLLLKLGYNETDLKKHFNMIMSNGLRVYLDYVILPDEDTSNKSAYWIWETRFTITDHKQLTEIFDKIKPYALHLNCNGFGILSKDGAWISDAKTNFEFDKMRYWSWKQIGEEDCFNIVYNIASKPRDQ